ncbi:UNVERIFIED_CONTAM: Protein-tyrosine-phosphatase MKP1 [Sesamum angustifolium]|uniref:Protein-tyrosine-phosphatase MKP1 n=1 Tax=Sesamum angustifolium TaxID=2727405 RepID=A0AAW2M9U4_9LAMI
MLREEEKDQTSGGSWTYSRSMSWTEGPPRKSNPKPLWNSKARACLPPLQPLSVVRPSFEEWPRAGSDDLGIWPNPPTPGARPRSITPRENATSDQPPREFESGKDKLAFFDKECSRILDHIYLGSDAIAKNREILSQNGITHVLNCVGFVCPEYFKNELVYRTLWLQDCPSEDITSILYDVFDYFEDVSEQGGRVLVHCCHGVSRSTSLVIAYLMWKEGQSFDDAFQHVRTARGVANPNVGFACQLLQCQKRVHALPASPTSVIRMYRMAPHSPYDPLHLVPKMLCEPGADKLDSRGAFIIHIPSALYVWIGKYCSSVMSDNAMAAASQVIRYEKAQGPVIIVKEGEETIEFRDAFGCGKCLADSGHVSSEGEKRSAAGSNMGSTVSPCIDQKKLNEYDLDFEIFHRALAGGIVPPLPLSEAGSVTRLPARENGWSRLSIKFASVTMEEFITSTKLESSALQTVDTCRELECTVSSADLSMPSTSTCDSPDSFASFVTSSPGWIENNSKEVEFPAPLSDTSLSRSSSSSLVDSFSSFSVSKPKSKSTSPSPAVSPSTSDYSSSFSPSSSNWSDLSFVSAQPSPYRLESRDIDPGKSDPPGENVSFVDDSTCLRDDVTSPTPEEAMSARHILREAGLCSTSGEISCSLVECRGSSHPSRMIFPSIDEASQISENLMRCLEDHAMDVECDKFSREVCFRMDGEEPISDANGHAAAAEVLSRLWDGKKYDTFHLTADDMTNKVAEASNLVFYKWPSIHKMDMHFGILDSRSVYIILIPALSFGTKIANALYVWIGRNVSSKGSHIQLIRNNSNYEDNHARVETIGRNLLHEEGSVQLRYSMPFQYSTMINFPLI